MNNKKTDNIPDDAMIFGLLLIISNRMNTLLERELKEFDVTTKQWFLSETISSVFDHPPTLKEAASAMEFSPECETGCHEASAERVAVTGKR